MRKVDDGKRKRKKKRKKRKKKRMAFLVATTSLPAVYRPNGYARTTIAGTPHARANLTIFKIVSKYLKIYDNPTTFEKIKQNLALT